MVALVRRSAVCVESVPPRRASANDCTDPAQRRMPRHRSSRSSRSHRAWQGRTRKFRLRLPTPSSMCFSKPDHPSAAVLDFAAHSSTPRFHVTDRASARVAKLQGRTRTWFGRKARRWLRGGLLQRAREQCQQPRSAPDCRDHQRRTPVSPCADGLSPTNSNARSRFIVIHEARYMDPESWKGKKRGRPGSAMAASFSRKPIATPSVSQQVYRGADLCVLREVAIAGRGEQRAESSRVAAVRCKPLALRLSAHDAVVLGRPPPA